MTCSINKKRKVIIAGVIISIIMGMIFCSDGTNAATKSYRGKFRMNGFRNEDYKKEIKTFTITKSGYIFLDLEILSVDKYFNYTFCDDDKIKIHVKGYDNEGKVIYNGSNKIKIKEDKDFAGAWFYYGGGHFKVPAGKYKVWLTFNSIMNLYKVDYTLQYFKKTIKKAKLPKKIRIKAGKGRYIKLNNKIDKHTFACVGPFKQSNNKVIFDGVPEKKAIFVYARKRGKCKITVITSYGIKTKATVIIR